ncbi:hypothetical protein [Leptospira meyeri]|uniref:Uncharacterized protein n=1 Tax=Leptospira meyeri TaxID=29508 RepID=A0A4R8MUB5_LEPME|nr:hypothetical protein [Leptospira meyeri]EKJ86569.1 hypothetical protein LEP1GSC017_1955 [Leptospira meyeri serovar Hardjo str. Went 5]EMJ88046.1 hypothetical protein LEP1GSC196_1451 [Leptospira meyeri serovar Semaranga str. Veldrot Semarang 173]TDY73030.1 hypothetical protein CLV96_2049 [Leptospira meyeri]TGL51113.1 hypothetical protein EHQ55_06015 [Leptospira meyeri]TGM64228.1 hypothetical protein EHQ94_16630 [Leptospira meyeri]
MWRYLFDLSTAEVFLFASLALAGIFLLVFGKLRKKETSTSSKTKQNNGLEDPSSQTSNKSKKDSKQSKDTNLKVMEVFDYNGTKILHQDGAYTVNDQGVVTNYMNWNLLPTKYQKMVKELDNRSLGEKGEDYFLEMINGFYYVSLPGGKKKKYDSIQSIPADIRKRLGV